jgi:hypothetical protein
MFPQMLANVPEALQKDAADKFASLGMTSLSPDPTSLDYFQAGARYTTTFGPVDFGAQYFDGYMYMPAYNKSILAEVANQLAEGRINDAYNLLTDKNHLPISYNRMHQIAVDAAFVLVGFNCRTELAANITNDLKGTNPNIYNPQLAWSFGFDRNLPWSITLNMEFNQTIRLLSPVDAQAYGQYIDVEKGSKATSTRMISYISRSFLNEELAVKMVAVWDIEDGDSLLIPSVTWTRAAFEISLLAGCFVGGNGTTWLSEWGPASAKTVDANGNTVSHNNTFVRLGFKYTF